MEILSLNSTPKPTATPPNPPRNKPKRTPTFFSDLLSIIGLIDLISGFFLAVVIFLSAPIGDARPMYLFLSVGAIVQGVVTWVLFNVIAEIAEYLATLATRDIQ